MSLEPQDASGARRIDPDLLPPDRFIATAMHFAMVAATERDRELIADLAPQRRALREPQMMGVAGLTTANQTRLLCHVADVIPVANPARFGEGKRALVD